jgi:hypothetical protein
MPAATATSVIRSDIIIPSHKNGRAPGIELKSKW